MQLYMMDSGVYGSIVVVAGNEADARLKIKGCENYFEDKPVTEYAIEEGLCLYNLGDM